ncbi:hypothetical protein evm_010376 [Chilo suppressalis]|nr:hypothetical protein evm_010376 [Chilo suppressalis]
MSSRKVEDAHVRMLAQLLVQSGLDCVKTPPASTESSSMTEEFEEHADALEEAQLVPEGEEVEEEQVPIIVEELQEEMPEIFPTPSLRRLIPDKTRKLEEQNRIHVLPDEFKTDIDPSAIPKISKTAPKKYIDMLADIVGCKEYKSSLAEFWFLDTLANLLRRAQEDKLDRPIQAVLILWFCEWIKEIQNFDAADRERMMKRFQDNMLCTARFIGEQEHIPTPAQAGVYYKAPEETSAMRSTGIMAGVQDTKTTATATAVESKHLVTFVGTAYECVLRDLTKIIHYIFDLFSTDYQYELVRSVFAYPPDYLLIDTPYQIQNPKRLYAPLKVKPKKEKSPKRDLKSAKGKKKEVDTEEYLALLELMQRDEREQEERELHDMESWNRRAHILPLQAVATSQLFDRIWPPPPPEPVPEPESEPKPKKGKNLSSKK